MNPKFFSGEHTVGVLERASYVQCRQTSVEETNAVIMSKDEIEDMGTNQQLTTPSGSSPAGSGTTGTKRNETR